MAPLLHLTEPVEEKQNIRQTACNLSTGGREDAVRRNAETARHDVA
jgi:hypothetical protein